MLWALMKLLKNFKNIFSFKKFLVIKKLHWHRWLTFPHFTCGTCEKWKLLLAFLMIHGEFRSFFIFLGFYDHLLQHIKYYWIAWGFVFIHTTRKGKEKNVYAVETAAAYIKTHCKINNKTIFLFLFFLEHHLQKCRTTWPAHDQKGRKRNGQLSNGINLTTQQVQQISIERLPLDEHS